MAEATYTAVKYLRPLLLGGGQRRLIIRHMANALRKAGIILAMRRYSYWPLTIKYISEAMGIGDNRINDYLSASAISTIIVSRRVNFNRAEISSPSKSLTYGSSFLMAYLKYNNHD